jgi:hypothetical protein
MSEIARISKAPTSKDPAFRVLASEVIEGNLAHELKVPEVAQQMC